MAKRARTSVGSSAVVNLWNRELGELSTRSFAHRLAASQGLVLRLDILRTLDKHRGCVNTVSFNAAGDILVSGSDDRRVILWDWETGHDKLSFHSGHHNNVFQAKIMPYSDDRSIVTCAADGQVRHAQILECGVETKLLAKHHGRVHKLAVEPGSPHIFYTCGEDGLVQHIDLRTGTATCLFTCKPLQSHSYMSSVNLNAIAIDPRNPNLFSVGGSDQFARLFDIRRYKWDGSSEFGRPVDFFCPPHLIEDDHVGITGLAFSEQSELLVSYSDEFIYLFTKDVGLGPDPIFTSQDSNGSDAGDMTLDNSNDNDGAPQAYKGHMNCETVKGVNFFGPKSEYIVSGSDCGRIFIWKKQGGELIRVMEGDKHVVNCIESHPHDTVLASSGIEHDIKMWIPKAIDRATLPTNIQKGKVPRVGPRRFGLFSLVGFYDDDDESDDFIYDDDDDDDDDTDSDDDDDDCDDETDDDDDDETNDDGGDDRENEVLNEEQPEKEEEDTEGDDDADCVSTQETDDNEDNSPENLYNNEVEDIGGTDNVASDDSFNDAFDFDDHSDYGCSDNDFDD